jgi:hypothetical protein
MLSDGKNSSSTVHISMKDDEEDESDSGDEMMTTRTDPVKMTNPTRKSMLTKLKRRKGNDQNFDKTRAVETRSPNMDTQGLINQGVSLTQEPKLMSLAALDGMS